MPKSYPLYYDNDELGTMTVERDGLRLRLYAVSKPLEGVCRAFAISGGERLAIGVLAPEKGVMTACKTYNLSAIRGFNWECVSHGEICSTTRRTDWTRLHDPEALFTDPVVRDSLDLGLEYWTRPSDKGRLVAVYWPVGTAFPLPFLFCLCSVEKISGHRAVVFCCGEDGRPKTP